MRHFIAELPGPPHNHQDHKSLGNRNLFEQSENPFRLRVIEVVISRKVLDFLHSIPETSRLGAAYECVVGVLDRTATNRAGLIALQVPGFLGCFCRESFMCSFPGKYTNFRRSLALPNQVPNRTLTLRAGARRTYLLQIHFFLQSKGVSTLDRENTALIRERGDDAGTSLGEALILMISSISA